MAHKPVKLIIEFTSAEAALEWFDAEVEEEHLPYDTDAYKADALDLTGGNAATYIVAKLGTRPGNHSLRATT